MCLSRIKRFLDLTTVVSGRRGRWFKSSRPDFFVSFVQRGYFSTTSIPPLIQLVQCMCGCSEFRQRRVRRKSSAPLPGHRGLEKLPSRWWPLAPDVRRSRFYSRHGIRQLDEAASSNAQEIDDWRPKLILSIVGRQSHHQFLRRRWGLMVLLNYDDTCPRIDDSFLGVPRNRFLQMLAPIDLARGMLCYLSPKRILME